MKKPKESTLYNPIKHFFTARGYTVHGEVLGCDVVAEKDGCLVVVEMKTQFSLKLLYQAIDRQQGADNVFVCIPRPASFSPNAVKGMLAIVKRLSLGLMTVALDSPLQTVDIIVYPGGTKTSQKNRARLEAELSGRSNDLNTGGAAGAKINTAYRERAVHLACVLEKNSSLSLARLVREYGFSKDIGAMLRRNYYGWFERAARGVYGLSAQGKQALNDEKLAALVAYYREMKHCIPK